MIDIKCRTCGKKLGWQEEDARGVEIPCHRCHTKNLVMPLVRMPALASLTTVFATAT